MDLFKAMDVNPFHSFYGVQKIFHHFFGQPETKVAYLFVGYIPNIVILSQAITHCQLRFIPQEKILPFALIQSIEETTQH